MSQLSQHAAGEVRRLLHARGLTGSEAARRLGWTQPYLSRRLTGHVDLSLSELEALADLLRVRPFALVRAYENIRWYLRAVMTCAESYSQRHAD